MANIDSGFIFFVDRLEAVWMDVLSAVIFSLPVVTREDSVVDRKRISVMGCKGCCVALTWVDDEGEALAL
jgi:hypothetical protein